MKPEYLKQQNTLNRGPFAPVRGVNPVEYCVPAELPGRWRVTAWDLFTHAANHIDQGVEKAASIMAP